MAVTRQIEQLEGLFEVVPIGLGILGRDLRFEKVNRALSRMDGIAPEGHVGRTVDELLPDFGPELSDAIARAAATGEIVELVPVTGTAPDPLGERKVWLVSAYPLSRGGGGGDSSETDRADGLGTEGLGTEGLGTEELGTEELGIEGLRAGGRAWDAIGLTVAEEGGFKELEARLHDLSARSQMLNDFYIAAVRRHTDEREILDLLARRSAERVGDASFVSIVHGGRLEAIATWARDREQRRFAERLLPLSGALDDLPADRPPLSDRVVVLSAVSESDRAVLVDAATPTIRPFLERFAPHAIISVPLRVEGRVVGSVDLVRTDDPRAADPGVADPRTDDPRPADARTDYSRDDVAFVESLALRASLVLENARAIVERETMRRRAEVTAEFLEAVAERGYDDRAVLRVLAEHSARAVGDAALAVTRDPNGGWLEMAALESTDADLDAAVRQRLEGRRISVDTDADADTDDEPAGLDALIGPDGVALREALEPIGAPGIIAQPLHAGGQPAGALVMLRGEGAAPYNADEVDLIRNLAGRTSLALDNVRTHVALSETAARLATILEESPVATVELDPTLRVVRWNRAAEAMFGWTEEELCGQPLPIVPPERQEEVAGIAQRALAGEVIRGLETVRLHRDGRRVEVAAYDAAVPGPDGRPTGVILRMVDIGERKRLETDLQRTTETLRAILDASPLAIMAVDLDRHLTYWSKGAESLYGWTAHEVVGKTPPYLLRTEPDPLEPHLARVRAGESNTIDDVRRIARSGEIVTVRIFSAPIRDETGAVVGMLGIHEDLRAHRRLEAQLFEARKMESVGRLAGGIAHDFNNILTAIIGFADLALSEQMSAPVQSSLTTIKASAERAAGLTQQLLAFSRRQMLQPQVVDPNEVVIRMEAILRQLIGEQIDLAISVTPSVGSIRVDPTQLEQVILNLALNARDAMPRGGRLAIRTERTSFDEATLSRHFEVAPGEYVQISVTDTGIGMDEATQGQIFEPFFTTKDPGAGTGLGLATTYGIVKQSGGYIWVYSEPGRGTSFKLHFPAIPDVATTERRAPGVGGRRSGRILLVEDEPVLRELGRQVLARQGYEVVVAAHGSDALRIADQARSGGERPFDLLMTDIVMPRISGTDLARQMRESQPGLPVLLMSGYAEEIAAGSMRDAAFLAKPFTPETLLRAVDEAMRERRRARR